MSLQKQSKTLSKKQVSAISAYLGDKRNGLRNQTIFLLSVKAGLRAKEIAELEWGMVLTSDGEVGNEIQLDRGLSAMGTEQSLNEQVGVVARHPNLTPYTRSRQRGFSG